MCSKLGFFPTIEIDSNVLKYIIASFPYIIKNKGSEIGIKLAVNSILKSQQGYNSGKGVYVDIQTKSSDTDDPTISDDSYVAIIMTPTEIENKQALKEVMKYVLPIGMTYRTVKYKALDDGVTTRIDTQDEADLLYTPNLYASVIRSTGVDTSTIKLNGSIQDSQISAEEMIKRVVGSYRTSTIAGSSTTLDNENNEFYINSNPSNSEVSDESE